MKRKIFLYNQYLTEKLEISDEKIIHRLKNVLRLKPGEKIYFLNNFEEEAEYEVLDNKKWIFKRIDYHLRTLKPKRQINLLISLIRKEKFELILEKGTELGVYSFQPIITQRSSLKIKEIPERWLRIIGESLEVTNWQQTPEIKEIKTLKEVLDEDLENFYIAHKKGEKIDLNKLPQKINLLIGPEGGFSEEEEKILKEKGRFISLGEIDFRTETAVLIFLSLLNFS
ncbi:Ribosomal RNA small subunit methyltransferase E [bacterium HR35]|nr:Ribosomal RNA small subunit methyltransferase E [bacterium HR35]